MSVLQRFCTLWVSTGSIQTG